MGDVYTYKYGIKKCHDHCGSVMIQDRSVGAPAGVGLTLNYHNDQYVFREVWELRLFLLKKTGFEVSKAYKNYQKY